MKQHRYERIAQLLEERIASGSVAVGETLPTEAQLCQRYAVSRYTAREALRRLRDAGLITRRPRTGSTVSGEDLAALECRRGQPWIKLSGVRLRPGVATPVCLINVYLNTALAGLEKRLPRSSGVIYPQVEKALGVRISWIGHRIEARLLDEAEAKRLRAKPGAPALRVRRFYYDANERLLELSDSLHAAERFAYQMRLKRD
jgi:DNA-binding GntR family transcriptional regulator